MTSPPRNEAHEPAHRAALEPARGQAFTLEPLPAIAGLERDWSALAERGGNVFVTWEWASSWWRCFGRARPLRLIGCRRRSGELAAIVPLYEAARRPARVVRPIGHGAADELGPVCAQTDRAAAARALGALLTDAAFPWDAAILDDLAADLPWGELVAAGRLVLRASPAVGTAVTTWEDWLATRSRNLRSQVGKRERRLARKGRLRYRTCDDPERLERDFDTFLALHRARWAAIAGAGAFTGREAFHRQFAALALRRGWLRLRFLELDGRPLAALYNLRFGGAESCYQAGRDPAFEADSVGFVLHAHAIRETIADGLDEYRFLRGGEEYKWRFADRDRGVETIARANGPRGRLALAAFAAQPRLPRALRRRIPAALAWGTGAPRSGG